jgi:hypothetical protein
VLLDSGFNRSYDLVFSAGVKNNYPLTAGASGTLNFSNLTLGMCIAWIHQHGNELSRRDGLS